MQIWLTNTAIWYSAFQGAELIPHDNLNGTVHYHRTRLMNEGEAKCQNLDVPVSRESLLFIGILGKFFRNWCWSLCCWKLPATFWKYIKWWFIIRKDEGRIPAPRLVILMLVTNHFPSDPQAHALPPNPGLIGHTLQLPSSDVGRRRTHLACFLQPFSKVDPMNTVQQTRTLLAAVMGTAHIWSNTDFCTMVKKYTWGLFLHSSAQEKITVNWMKLFLW